MSFSNEELINIAKNHSIHFTTTREWDKYAITHNLPRSHVFKVRFLRWNNAKHAAGIQNLKKDEKSSETKRQILTKVNPYKEYITTVKSWNEFASLNGLPLSNIVIYAFGTWNKFKKAAGIFKNKEERKKEKTITFINIAKEHIEMFSGSAEHWKKYAQLNKLPSTNTYIEHFGSWADAKRAAGVREESIKSLPFKYERAYLIEQAKNFSIYFERTSDWDKFAKEKCLPSASAYIAHFGSMEKAKKEVGIEKIKTRKNYTTEELTKVALENKKYFTTEKKWDSHAKIHNLPRHKAYINAFRSWKKAKAAILGET